MTGGSSGIGLEIARQLGEMEARSARAVGVHNLCLSSHHQPRPSSPSHPPSFPSTPGLHGATVCITGRRQAVLDAAVADLRACGVAAVHAFRGDVRNQADTAAWASGAAAKGGGGLDILVNCAAGNFLVKERKGEERKSSLHAAPFNLPISSFSLHPSHLSFPSFRPPPTPCRPTASARCWTATRAAPFRLPAPPRRP